MGRVRSGARLFSVLRDQEDLNQKPLELMQTVLDNQFKATLVKGDEEQEQLKVDDSEIDILRDLQNMKFDPRMEITKEK